MTRSHTIYLRYRNGLILIAVGLCVTCGGTSSSDGSDADGKNPGDGGAAADDDQAISDFEIDSRGEQQHRELLRAAWSVDLPLPDDQRDPAPMWEGPPALDETSSTPFCPPFEIPPRLVGMHADDRGLFVGIARHCDETLAGGQCDPTEGSVLYRHSSSEWKVLATPGTRFETMRVTPNGPFFFGANVRFDPERGVQIMEDPYYGAAKTQIVPTGDTVFLIAQDELGFFQPAHTFLAQLESDVWVQRTTLDAGWNSLAGDPSGNLLIDGVRELLVGQPESLTTVEGPPESIVLGSIWAESPTKFWFATDDGQIWHYNGAFEALFDASDNEYSQISLYHDDDRLYVMTPSVFGYLTDSGFTTVSSLLDAPTRSFIALTAADGDGVYVALLDRKLEPYRCGSLVVMRFDGAKFERI